MINRLFFLMALGLGSACSTQKTDRPQDSVASDTIHTRPYKLSSDSTESPNDGSFDYDKAFRIESYLVPKPPNPTEITVINQTCAIFTYPDDKAIEAMKEKHGDDFYIIADDVNWYRYESGQLLDSLKVNQVTVDTRYLEFIKSGKSYFIDTQALGGGWSLFFIHSKKEAKVMSMAGLSGDSVRAYFDLP
jgi:hypothetical protein